MKKVLMIKEVFNRAESQKKKFYEGANEPTDSKLRMTAFVGKNGKLYVSRKADYYENLLGEI